MGMVDRTGFVDAEEAGPVALLEDRDDGAERCADREQEAERSLERYHDRAEDQHQEDEGETDDDREVGDEGVLHFLAHVDVQGGGAGDLEVGAGG
jgi:hypothetical protein